MHTRKTYSLTDAMSYCLQQPGVTAASFVDIKTGIPLITQGESSLPTEMLVPYLTDWYRRVQARTRFFSGSKQSHYLDDRQQAAGEVKVTLGDHTHLIYPLSNEATGVCVYLTLDQEGNDLPCIRRCLSRINTKLHL